MVHVCGDLISEGAKLENVHGGTDQSSVTFFTLLCCNVRCVTLKGFKIPWPWISPSQNQ